MCITINFVTIFRSLKKCITIFAPIYLNKITTKLNNSSLKIKLAFTRALTVADDLVRFIIEPSFTIANQDNKMIDRIII